MMTIVFQSQQRVDNKDTVFMNYWKKIQANPDLTTPDLISAMKRLSEPGTFFLTAKERVITLVSTDLDQANNEF